jgi:xanthine dehydrogenase molybdenum-binding subunit
MAEKGIYDGIELKTKYVNIGKSPTPEDAILKVTGRGKFAQDIKVPGMLWGKILRSPYAHANIIRIDTSKAEELPGVVAVVTYADCPTLLIGDPHTKPIFNGAVGQKVRFVGDTIAGVAAETAEIAEEAIKLIEVDYEQLPVVLDPEEALKPDAPNIYPGGNFLGKEGATKENWIFDGSPTSFVPGKYTWIYEGADGGNGFNAPCDMEKGFREADFTFEFDGCNANIPCMRSQADTCIAQFVGNKLNLWTPTQDLTPHRDIIASAFGLPTSAVHIISECSGGGFGGARTPWIILGLETIILAKKAGRPVKLVSTERELLILSSHVCRGPSYVKVGARNDGTITALDITHYSDFGAVNFGADNPKYRWSTAVMFKPQNLSYKCYGAYTNKPPGGYMRGPGSEDIISLIEEAAMRVAEHIGMDPAEYHTRFCPPAGYLLPPGGPWSPMPNERMGLSTSFPDDIKAVIESIGWKDKYHAPGKGPIFDRCKKRGLGLSIFSKGFASLYSVEIMIKIQNDGSIALLYGTSNPGVGTHTGVCQIAAEVMGVITDDIGLVWGDSDGTPYGGHHGGSSGLISAGIGAIKAAQSVKAQLLERAARILNTTAGELDINGVDNIFIKKDPIKKTTIKKVMFETWPDYHDIVGYGAPIGSEEFKKRDSWMLWTSAARAYEVEVDTETGLVKVLNHTVSFNVGNAIHPKVLEGQASGGNWQGAWRTLSADEVLDPRTGVELTVSSVEREYTTMIDEPEVFTPIFRAVPEPSSPLGICAISENVLVGIRAAITAAVYNAIGVWVKPAPITPGKVLKALGKI